MIIRIDKKIGVNTMVIEIDEKDEKDALARATFYLQPDYCSNFSKTNIVWNSNRAKSQKDGKEYTYIKRKCLSCGAESVAGEYVSGGLFWKKFEVRQTNPEES